MSMYNKLFTKVINPVSKNKEMYYSLSEFKKEVENTNIILINEVPVYNSMIDDENSKFSEDSYNKDELVFSLFNKKNYIVAQETHTHPENEEDHDHSDITLLFKTIPNWNLNIKAELNKLYFLLFDLFGFTAINLNADNKMDEREFESCFILVDGKFIRNDAILYIIENETTATNNITKEVMEGTVYSIGVKLSPDDNDEIITFNVFRKKDSISKQNFDKWIKLRLSI